MRYVVELWIFNVKPTPQSFIFNSKNLILANGDDKIGVRIMRMSIFSIHLSDVCFGDFEMLNKLIPLTAFLNLLIAFNVKAMVVKDERGKVEVNVPKAWRYERNLLGLPHVFLTNESPVRSTLSLTLTGIEGVKLLGDNLEKTQQDYQTGRKVWADTRNAQNINFIPYSKSENPERIKIHQIGFEYDLAGKRYLEKTYYVECPKSLVNLKLLALKKSEKIKEAESIVSSLRCESYAGK